MLTLRLLSLVLLFTVACVLPSFALAADAPNKSDAPTKFRLYIGTYTDGDSQGIYMSELDLASGELSQPVLAAKIVNPSFLAIHPNRKYLYAVSEIPGSDGHKSGAVAALAIDPRTGQLKLLNRQSSEGAGPCHLSVDATGSAVLVANYGGGSVASLPIGPDGRLAPAASAIQHQGKSVNPQRQEGPHAHSINLDPKNRFAVAADLGLDEVLVYRFDPDKKSLTPNDPPAAAVAPGAGPRHFAFHPGGKFAYVINEIGNTITAFDYDGEAGVLKEMQSISTLPDDFNGTSYTAEVVAHPSGKFLYGSNRGHDSIAMFSIDQDTGRLTSLGQEPTGGKTPRNFAIDPTGAYLLAENQDSGTITVFRIDQESGRLTATGHSLEVPRPVCVRFLPIDE
jgi:6-phosphogluconolactonase